MKIVSQVVSWLFLPLFTPVYALLIVLYFQSLPKTFQLWDSLYHYPPELKISFIYLFLIFTAVAPGLSLVMLKVNKTISSLSLDNREERAVPIGIMVFYCLVLFGVMAYQEGHMPTILKAMAIGGAISAIFALWITKSYKISLHGLGVGSLTGFLFSYYLQMEFFYIELLYLSIFIGALVLSARFYLEKHSLPQLFLGYLLGFGCQFLSIYFYPS
jgi:hypothetical protein